MSDFRLRVFCCVAKNLSYTKAAQELQVTQPAITKHIHELETQYGTRLFERQGNHIQLTSAGLLLLDHANRILDEYTQLNFAMNLLQGVHRGELRLGASTTISHYVLPPLLAKFNAKFPEVTLSLTNGNTNIIEEELAAHHIDLGLIEGDRRSPNLKYTHFLDDELVALASTHSRFAAKDEMNLEELKSSPLVLRENGSGTLSVFRNALEKKGIRLNDLNVLMQLGSSESIKLFLENADAFSVLSIRCVTRELLHDRLKVIELPELEMKRELDFVELQGEDTGLPALFMQFAFHELL